VAEPDPYFTGLRDFTGLRAEAADRPPFETVMRRARRVARRRWALVLLSVVLVVLALVVVGPVS
jgi:hypothetical protein